ncbi:MULTISPECIES: aldose 1-epimerase family protein [Enterococcus]|uniref:aldose 1-epimerase family protein n=1 Tax=Enterococcus TaxID=1350 RepID=UPI00065DE101|nr:MULTISPECIES: aldose 1-epimerase family protein [Enterococcus]KAF1304781.1 aldose epimerase [Enterococcus sp. JM9B]
MSIIIENDQLIAVIAEHGAELQSLKNKENQLEYIWKGDPEYWGKHAPLLFPIVGALKNDHYQYQGKNYTLPRHGFARNMDFEVVNHTAESVSFLLKSSEETRENYPFDFELYVHYELGGDGIQVRYEVINLSEEEMFFSIGGHPAFNVPLDPALSFEDYYLAFSPRKSRLILPLEGNYVNMDQRTLGQTNTNIGLTHELFKNDALIYETKGLNSISICSEKSPHGVTLTYNNMPYVGIWSPTPKEAPFVCIEPWVGIADTLDASGDLVEKLGIQQLAGRESFQTKYAITLR